MLQTNLSFFYQNFKFISFSIITTAFLILTFSTNTYAQGCIPSKGALYYIVRDKKGNIVDPAELKTKPSKTDVIEITDEKNNEVKKVNVVSYGEYHSQGCGITLNKIEFSLEYKGKTMNLTFNNVKGYKIVMVDSIPFKEGNYEIDTRSERHKSGIVSATGWKKID